MNSVSYVNNGCEESVCNDFLLQLNESIEDFFRESEDAEIEYRLNTNRLVLEKEIMGVLYESDELYLEVEGKNFVEKLGNAIIELGKFIIRKIQEFIDKIKDEIFGFRSIKKRFEMLERNTNYTNEEIKVICKNGKLDLASYKTFNEMLDAFNKACEEASKGVEPTAIQKHFEKVFGKDATISDADKAIKISNYTQAEANKTAALIKAATLSKQYEIKCAEAMEKSKKAQNNTKNAINSAKDSTTDPETQRILNKYFGELSKELQNIISQDNQLLTSMKSALTDFVNEAEKKADAENNSDKEENK